MILLAYIWAWLIIGAAIGRVAFVRVLADQPRRGTAVRVDERGRNHTVEGAWTDSFRRAVWAGIICVMVWPVALPVSLMLARTGDEKLRARRERLAAEVARLEQEAQR